MIFMFGMQNFLPFSGEIAFAACAPAECGEMGIDYCKSSEHCIQKCCVPKPCFPSCTGYCGTKADGCGGTCACVECGPSAFPACGNYVKLYNCRSTERGCTECGPYGSQSCGDWTQTYDCSGNQSGCNECGPSLGTWSACDSNHKRTQTCSENCGTNDCDALGAVGGIITQDCVETITGTLFDASDISSCGQMGTEEKYANQQFTITPVNVGMWPIISGSAPTVTTNAAGVYTQNVYASSTLPASYTLDYTSLIASGLAAGIKLECQTAMPTVTGQAEVVTKDTGFWRVYGGWWQAVGGNVYAGKGLQSNVPASVPPLVAPYTKQRLILADGSGRTGVLSHGFAWQGTELGTNPNVGVSDDLWRIQSEYGGLRYDYNFYNTRMDIFASKTWTDDSISTYDDGGTGYQIFKSSTGIDLNSPVTLNAGQKIVILVNGNVNVNTNITVNPGSFISIIANGTITFNSTVTKAQGWFVGENINVPCKDTGAAGCDKDDAQFDGQGTFVGWSGVSLGRDQGLPNNQAPSEKFTYRTDMLLNAPEPMKVYTKRFSPFIP